MSRIEVALACFVGIGLACMCFSCIHTIVSYYKDKKRWEEYKKI